MKKLLAVLLAVLMVAGVLPMVASADNFSDGYYFTVKNGEATISGYTGNGGDLIIPSSLDGYPVVAIGEEAFYNCDSLTSVIFSDTILEIGSSAFYDCDSLKSVVLPKYITTIKARTFFSCDRLASLTISDSVRSIGERAFWFCSNLTDVWYSSSKATADTIYIGSDNGSLTGATWHYYTCWGEHTYDDDCDFSCNKCTFTRNVAHNFVDDVCSYCQKSAFEFSLNAQGDGMVITGYLGSGGKVVIPQTIQGKPVVEIGTSAFSQETGISEITIPESVRTIGKNAFYDCTGLKSVTIPNGVTTIGEQAFYGCYLTQVTIPESVTKIESGAFTNCSYLTTVNITGISAWCNIEFGIYAANPLQQSRANLYVKGVKVTNLEIPQGVTTIGAYAFYNCDSIDSVTIPQSVTTIGYHAFEACDGLRVAYYTGTQEEWEAITGDGKPTLSDLLRFNIPVSLAVKTLPHKTRYCIGEGMLDTTGLSLVLTYHDGTQEVISSGYTTDNPDINILGTKTIMVSYEGLSTTFTVEVTEPWVELSTTSVYLSVGQQTFLTATTVPAGQPVIWLSSNTAVADIANNIVTAYSIGTAEISAQFLYNDKVYNSVCKVIVLSPEDAADQIAAKQVSDLIGELPKVITLEDKEKIETARNAYNLLTESQKALVVGYDNLVVAEETYEKLQLVSKAGDVNGDTQINAKDALEVLKAVVGKVKFTEQQKVLADVNKDEDINAKDALEILKHSVGKPSALGTKA